MQFLYQLVLITICLLVSGKNLHAEVIFQENFDSRPDWSSSTKTAVAETWPSTMQNIIGGPVTTNSPPAWYSYRSAQISHTTGDPLYVVDNKDPHGGTGKSLRYNIENQSYMNGGGLDLVLCNSGTCGWDEIFISFYIKLESDFDFKNGGSQFIKLARLYSGVDVVNDNLSPSSTYSTTEDAAATPQFKRSMNCYLDIVTDGNEDYRLKLSYFLGQKSGIDYKEIIKTSPASTFNFAGHLGSWIYVQWYAKMNTVGQTDGQMKVWLIPESNLASFNASSPTIQWDDLQIRSDSSRKFNTIILADNMSGIWERPKNEQTIVFDDLTIGTAINDPQLVATNPKPFPLIKLITSITK